MSEEIKSKRWEVKWSAEKVMSISALFISAISLFALFYQLNLGREENELTRKQQSASVLPYLQFENVYNVRAFSIHLINKGVGPAFIKEVSFVLNDSVQFDNSTDALLYKMKERVAIGDSISYTGSMTITKNTVVQPSENIRVFEISSKDKDDYSGVKNFKNQMNKTPPAFTIIYEDIYGHRWELSNKNNEQGFQYLTPVQIKKAD
ncbi:hypothetical protein RQM59_11165 [Flavobacteriaceae bacterium S356]|uniref:Uncharacterized protein n=1 Tax=Asprobacillus argus TaxID=3076534 RepID=A0ABU3LIK6_9FLAO|nr:hypothetical protein [Flavobacteriaceae bacterium S356]